MDETQFILITHNPSGLTFEVRLTEQEIEEANQDQNYADQLAEKYHQLYTNGYLFPTNAAEENNENIPSTSSGTRNANWNKESIKLLLDRRLGAEHKFNNPKCKKNKLWQKISEELKSIGGLNFSGNECDNKYRNLLQTYRSNKDRQGRTGEGRVTWEYFELFDEVLGNKESSNPDPNILSSSIHSSEPRRTPKNKENTSKKLSMGEYLFYKKEKDLEQWKEKKEFKQKEIDAINNLAYAIRESSKKKRKHSDSESD